MYLISGGNTDHKRILVGVAVITKLLIYAFSIFVVGTFFDLYDFGVYLGAIQNVVHGSLPWANGVIFYYPPLGLIPCLVLYPVFLFGGYLWFFLSLSIFMLICDSITTLGVYHLAKKLYNEKYAFRAALLSATGISVGYYILCRMDPFIICLVILALCFSFDNKKLLGYFTVIVGFFSKLYPIVLYPFLAIHHKEKPTSLPIILWGVALTLFGVMVFSGYDAFLEYTGSVYVQTIPYLSYFLLGAEASPVSYELIVNIFRGLMVLVILSAIVYAYIKPKKLRTTLSLILLSLCTIILFSNYRSPQYIIWVSPFFAILVADDIVGILEYYLLQVLSYIEFPLAFYSVYTNAKYVQPWAPVFFLILFVAWGLLLYRVLSRVIKRGEKRVGKHQS